MPTSRHSAAPAAPSPQQPQPDGHRRTAVVVALAVAFAAAAALVVGLVAWPKVQADRLRTTPVPVTVSITAPNYQAGTDSPIPLHLSGTSLSGASVERDVYVSDPTDGFEAEPGTYALTVPASPLLSSGQLYVTSDISVTVDISDQGQVTTPPDQLAITFPVATADQMSDQAIEDAKEKALESGMAEEAVDGLVDQTTTYRASISSVTYSYTTETLQANGKTFSYVQLSSDSGDDLSSLNASLKDGAEKAAAHSAEPDLDDLESLDAEDATMYYTYDQCVTYFQDGVACIVAVSQQSFVAAAHGWTDVEVCFASMGGVDLSQRLPLLVADGDGYRASDELDSLCADAFSRYLASGQAPTMSSDASIGDAAGNASQVAADEAQGYLWFYVTPEGYQVYTSDYYIGSYADGRASIPVCDLDGSPVSNPAYTNRIAYLAPSGSMEVARG